MNAKPVAVNYPPPHGIEFVSRVEMGPACPWHHTPPKPPLARPFTPAIATKYIRRAGCAGPGKDALVVAHGDWKEGGQCAPSETKQGVLWASRSSILCEVTLTTAFDT